MVPNQERSTSGCILSPCLFNLYAEYIIRNAGLDEAQAGIKIAGRNINNLRYPYDATLMAKSKEPKSLLMKEKEESENLDPGIWSHHFIVIDGEVTGIVTDFILAGSKITADGDCSHEIKKHLMLGRKAMTNLDSIVKKQRYYIANKGSI